MPGRDSGLMLVVADSQPRRDELHGFGELEIARNDRGKVSWALTVVTDEPWHHERGECRLLIELDGKERLQGRAALIRSDRGRWHYFEGAGDLGRVVVFDDRT